MSNPYVKSVRHLDEIDIYQIGNLYEVKSHAVFHALKKLLCAGKRGAKDYEQDLMEAIESIERELQIVGLAESSAPGGTQDCGFRPTVHVGLPMDPEPEWDQRHPDLRFAVRGENGQFVYCKDAPSCGEFWARPVETEFDEQRIDVIGQNGNEGEHYELGLDLSRVTQHGFGCVTEINLDWKDAVDWSKSSPHHVFAYKTPTGGYGFAMHEPLKGEYIRRPSA